MGSQRVRHDWTAESNSAHNKDFLLLSIFLRTLPQSDFFFLPGSDRLWEIPLCFSDLRLRSFYPCFMHLPNSVDVSVEKCHVFEAPRCSISVTPSLYVCPRLGPISFPALVSASALFLGQIQVISLWPTPRICQCPQGQLQNLAQLCHVWPLWIPLLSVFMVSAVLECL